MPSLHKSNSSSGRKSSWQIPKGVAPGSWDYVQSGQIARHYDEFLENDPLTQLDWQIISSYLPAECRGKIAADFGTGTGRHLERILNEGFESVLAIDLSTEMLKVVAEKLSENSSVENGSIIPIQANLVELDGLASDCLDFGICMFSTLGMIKGSENRAEFLAHVKRILKPGGTFVVHAHNYWFNLRHPGGLRWLLGSVAGSLANKNEIGDRLAHYRSIKDMFIHSFSYRSLNHAIRQAGFSIENVHSLRPSGIEVSGYRTADVMKTVGWIMVCKA